MFGSKRSGMLFGHTHRVWYDEDGTRQEGEMEKAPDAWNGGHSTSYGLSAKDAAAAFAKMKLKRAEAAAAPKAE